MSLKGYIKSYAGKKMLKGRAQKIQRLKAFSNLETAKCIAVLFDATDTDNYTTARFLSKYLLENKIKFRGLGFAKPYDAEEPPSAYSGINLFTEKDFSIMGLPVDDALTEFIRYDYDMLIDIHQNQNYFIEAVNAFSMAKMKLGLKNKDAGYYDFMIDLQNGDSSSEAFIEHLKYYLNIIKAV